MKKEITKQSIQLFEEKGFSHTSIQDIVDAMNVTKGTFYYYFSSKEQLLMDIHLEYIDHLLQRQQTIIDDTTLTNEQKLIKIITMLIEDIKDKGSSGRVFFREIRHLNSNNIVKVKHKRKTFRLNIEEVIRKGQTTEEFKEDLRADMVAFGVLGITNYSYNWFSPEGDISPKELATLFSEMVLSGITNQ